VPCVRGVHASAVHERKARREGRINNVAAYYDLSDISAPI
jgi:hypothetical protein